MDEVELIPSRRDLPVPEHVLDGHVPLVLEASGQLVGLVRLRHAAAPHLGSGRFGCCVGCNELAISSDISLLFMIW